MDTQEIKGENGSYDGSKDSKLKREIIIEAKNQQQKEIYACFFTFVLLQYRCLRSGSWTVRERDRDYYQKGGGALIAKAKLTEKVEVERESVYICRAGEREGGRITVWV